MARQLTLFAGPLESTCARLRAILKEKAKPLERQGIVAPDWNHVRLYAACAAPEAVGILRYRRGLDSPLAQECLGHEFATMLEREVPLLKGAHVVLCAAQLGALLTSDAEVRRLKSLLKHHFAQIRVIFHVDEQARLLAQHYAYAVHEGRRHDLHQELALTAEKSWWKAALAARSGNTPDFGLFDDVQRPAPWLDFKALKALWARAFGKGNVVLMPADHSALFSEKGAQVFQASVTLKKPLGKVPAGRETFPEPAASLSRMRMFNVDLIRLMQAREIICPRDLWQQMLTSLRVPGAPLSPGSLFAISDHFKATNAALIKQFPALKEALTPDAPEPAWEEADPTFGFRATQYLAAFSHMINKRSTPRAEKQSQRQALEEASKKFDNLLNGKSASKADQTAQKRLLSQIKVNYQMVLGSQFRPHNDIGQVTEEVLAPPYSPVSPQDRKNGNSGNVIVGCMKNEAPYIIEWVAYHRAIGVDNFLIYTNDCSDGTDEILGRLQQMGLVQHRNNDNWKGNSPQQHALNQSLKEPVIRNAEWIIHIDVDEFMNVRTGNGTLDDLFAAVPDATNFAMTWRLFGHNGVADLNDRFVIDQFDTCAPRYCPKPHTVWGFKTMFRNIGAYAKISCHRPNKLSEAFENKVKWVNGSGQDMTDAAAHNGWRSSKKTIGYDLLQLNHYALRSAESFLIKRQRGRALHVDRSIGLNYWIRMDWGDHRDITIKRNLPRLQAEFDRLMEDTQLREAHEAGLAWHRAKANELHEIPEFQELFEQAVALKLTQDERVAYALALDMEN